MVNFLATFLQSLQGNIDTNLQFDKENVKFEWTNECQQAFDKIKAKTYKPT